MSWRETWGAMVAKAKTEPALVLAAVLVGLSTILSAGTSLTVWKLTNDERREDDIEFAQGCVSAHQRHRTLEQSIRELAPLGPEVTLQVIIDFVQANPDPNDPVTAPLDRLFDFIDARLEPRVNEILSHFPPPVCDLAEAEALLDGQAP